MNPRERERERCRLYGKTRRKRDQRKPDAMTREASGRLGGLTRARNFLKADNERLRRLLESEGVHAQSEETEEKESSESK